METKFILNSELLATCQAIGHYDDKAKIYHQDEDCAACLKDLLRFLRRDDSRQTTRRQLGQANIVATDLVHLVTDETLDNGNMFDIVIRLFVNLTTPALLLFREEVPDEKQEKQRYLELLRYLHNYKMVLGRNVRVWTVMTKYVTAFLQKDYEDRQEEDRLLTERILILTRNVLHIPVDYDIEKVVDGDYNSHDRVLEVMKVSGLMDVIANMVGSESQYCFHLLEIISLVFREQNAEALAALPDVNAVNVLSGHRNDRKKEKDMHELRDLVNSDRSRLRPSYSRFKEATYRVANVKSISDRELICHKMPSDMNRLPFVQKSSAVRKAKNRQPLAESSLTASGGRIHDSPVGVQHALRYFAGKVLTNYNHIMRTVRENLERRRNEDNDETYYLWSFQFFMEFSRCSANPVDTIKETISVGSFHFLHTLITSHSERLAIEKKNWLPWSRRLHYAVKAYRELLFTLAAMDSSRDSILREAAGAMKATVFYELEYRDLILCLICNYNEVKMSANYLADVIDTNHVFLKMLERYSKANEHLIVKARDRRRRKKAKAKKAKEQPEQEDTPENRPEFVWMEIAPDVSDAVQGKIDLPNVESNESVRAIDPTSEKTSDEQKVEVKERIRNALRDRRVPEAVALYRNARDFWLAGDDLTFGGRDIDPEEELFALQDMLTANDNSGQVEDEKEKEGGLEEEFGDEVLQPVEKEFSFQAFVLSYSSSKVMQAIVKLLKTYDRNSTQTNHNLVKLMHRIAWDTKLHAYFFQASIFLVFQKILTDPLVKTSPVLRDMAKFIGYIMSRFVAVAKKNRKVFMELLFWKSNRVAYELEEGYDVSVTRPSKKSGVWNDEEMKELELLYNQFKDVQHEEKDTVDLILDHLTDDLRTRRQVIKQMKVQQLPLKKTRRKKKSKQGMNGEDEGGGGDADDDRVSDESDDEEIVENFEETDGDTTLEGEDLKEDSMNKSRADAAIISDQVEDLINRIVNADSNFDGRVTDDVFDKERDEAIIAKRTTKRTVLDSDDESTNEVGNVNALHTDDLPNDDDEVVVTKKRRTFFDSDDENSNEAMNVAEVTQESPVEDVENSFHPVKRRRVRLVSDDE